MPRNKPENHKEKLILLHDTVIEKLTEHAKENNMPVKNYIEYLCNAHAFAPAVKTIQSNITNGIETEI